MDDLMLPVAWGVPNTRITERQPMMMLLHSTDGCQYPEMLVPLYTADQMREYAKKAVEAEKERCAKVCENLWEVDGSFTAKEFADAVRGLPFRPPLD